MKLKNKLAVVKLVTQNLKLRLHYEAGDYLQSTTNFRQYLAIFTAFCGFILILLTLHKIHPTL